MSLIQPPAVRAVWTEVSAKLERDSNSQNLITKSSLPIPFLFLAPLFVLEIKTTDNEEDDDDDDDDDNDDSANCDSGRYPQQRYYIK